MPAGQALLHALSSGDGRTRPCIMRKSRGIPQQGMRQGRRNSLPSGSGTPLCDARHPVSDTIRWPELCRFRKEFQAQQA